MNDLLDRLPPYPIERLMALVFDVKPNAELPLIKFSIGEPRHPMPAVIGEALASATATMGAYPTVGGTPALRTAIAGWIARRFAPAKVDPACEVQAVNGTREGLFSLARTAIDQKQSERYVVYPNPGYAVYEGATVLSGLKPYPYDSTSGSRNGEIFKAIPEQVWRNTAMLFVCSPDNPMGTVQNIGGWTTLFGLADRYGFILAVDECYSEIYTDPARAPMGALQAAAILGRGFERLVVFSSLSKRSNAPGLRSGFMAGDRALLAKAGLYRSYNGGGMNPAVDAASVAAWSDEAHVVSSQALYRRKYEEVIPLIRRALPVTTPDAGFFLWADVSATGLTDSEFAKRLYERYSVLTMPGSYLESEFSAEGKRFDRVRIALVADMQECLEGARRIQAFVAEECAVAL